MMKHVHLLVLPLLLFARLRGRPLMIDPGDLLHQLPTILFNVGRPRAMRLGMESERVIVGGVIS